MLGFILDLQDALGEIVISYRIWPLNVAWITCDCGFDGGHILDRYGRPVRSPTCFDAPFTILDMAYVHRKLAYTYDVHYILRRVTRIRASLLVLSYAHSRVHLFTYLAFN